MSRQRAIAGGLVWLALFGAAAPARADCDPAAGKIVVARFVRCESAAHYLYSAVTSQKPFDARARDYYCTPAIGEHEAGDAGAVLVAWAVSELPLEWGPEKAAPRSYLAPRGWQPVLEPARYAWQGTLEECRALEPGALLKLKVGEPCCDPASITPVGCVAYLHNATPVSPELAKRLPVAFERPLLVNDHPLAPPDLTPSR